MFILIIIFHESVFCLRLFRRYVSGGMLSTYLWNHFRDSTRMELTVVLTSGWFLCHFNSQQTDTSLNLNHQHLSSHTCTLLHVLPVSMLSLDPVQGKLYEQCWYCPSTFAWDISICNEQPASKFILYSWVNTAVMCSLIFCICNQLIKKNRHHSVP